MSDSGRDADSAQSPPHNIEAEQQLLGALLLNNDVAARIAHLTRDDFYDPVHGRIFALAMSRVGRGKLASAVTLRPFLMDDQGLAELGGVGYLANLAGSAISILAASEYAEMLRDLAMRRKLIAVAKDVQARANDFSDDAGPPSAQIAAAEEALFRVTEESGDAGQVDSFGAVLLAAVDDANDAYMRAGSGDFVRTGIDDLDKIIGGLRSGLYLIQGTSSMGKTALGIEMIAELLHQGLGVFFGSLEMPKSQIGQRYISRALFKRRGLYVPYFDIARGALNEDQMRAYIEVSRDEANRPLRVVDENITNVWSLIGAARRSAKIFEARGVKTGAIVVDYLQLLTAPEARGDKVREVGMAVRALKALANDLDCPVIAMAQTKPEVEDRKNRRPTRRDIQWASEAHQAADVVIGVYRDDYYLRQDITGEDNDEKRAKLISRLDSVVGKVECIVAKHRGGPTGIATAYVDLLINAFADTPFPDPSRPARGMPEYERQEAFV